MKQSIINVYLLMILALSLASAVPAQAAKSDLELECDASAHQHMTIAFHKDVAEIYICPFVNSCDLPCATNGQPTAVAKKAPADDTAKRITYKLDSGVAFIKENISIPKKVKSLDDVLIDGKKVYDNCPYFLQLPSMGCDPKK